LVIAQPVGGQPAGDSVQPGAQVLGRLQAGDGGLLRGRDGPWRQRLGGVVDERRRRLGRLRVAGRGRGRGLAGARREAAGAVLLRVLAGGSAVAAGAAVDLPLLQGRAAAAGNK
jgi:hypothetical protein